MMGEETYVLQMTLTVEAHQAAWRILAGLLRVAGIMPEAHRLV